MRRAGKDAHLTLRERSERQGYRPCIGERLQMAISWSQHRFHEDRKVGAGSIAASGKAQTWSTWLVAGRPARYAKSSTPSSALSPSSPRDQSQRQRGLSHRLSPRSRTPTSRPKASYGKAASRDYLGTSKVRLDFLAGHVVLAPHSPARLTPQLQQVRAPQKPASRLSSDR